MGHGYHRIGDTLPRGEAAMTHKPSQWDTRFLAMADLVAGWSKDPSTQVGAVVVDAFNRVVSTGFNGFPRGIKDEYSSRETKLLRTVHAEVNAILFARYDLRGSRMYTTHLPCSRCAVQIIQAGLTCVIAPAPTPEFKDRWGAELAESMTLLREAGVTIMEIET